MNKEEQLKFVRDLVGSVSKDIVSTVAEGKTPADWDGHELRQYIADTFTEKCIVRKMPHGRFKAYRNAVIVNNLWKGI